MTTTRLQQTLALLADTIEAEAYREIFSAAPPSLAAGLGLAVHDIAAATVLVAPGVPDPVFNRVIGLGNTHPVTAAELDTLASLYRDAGVKDWWIHLNPHAVQTALAAQLDALGFAPAPRPGWAKFMRGTQPPPTANTGLEVRPVHSNESAALGATIAAAFDMPEAWSDWFARLALAPHWHGVVALDNGSVVGGGLLRILAGTAWLGAGGVRPQARRHGAHRALLTARIRSAIDAGCTQLFTETGEPVGDEANPSLHNIEACGFGKLCSRLNFAANSL